MSDMGDILNRAEERGWKKVNKLYHIAAVGKEKKEPEGESDGDGSEDEEEGDE